MAKHPVFADGDTPLELIAAYSELQKLLLQGPDVQEFLSHVALVAAAVTAPSSSCGITLDRDGEVSTIAATSSLASRADEVQYGNRQGPCLQSLNTGTVVHVPDLATETRWPSYRIHALTQGVRSSLSTPLFVQDEPIGAMNIYTAVQHEFTPAEIQQAGKFADQASAALTLVIRHGERVVIEDQLRKTIDSRTTIDLALGIIMGRQRCNATEAFEVLRKASQDRNIKLATIAADLVAEATAKPRR